MLSRDEVSLIISTKIRDKFCTTFSSWITLRVIKITALRVHINNVSVVPLEIFPE